MELKAKFILKGSAKTSIWSLELKEHIIGPVFQDVSPTLEPQSLLERWVIHS